jgi:diaminopimelate decarboxylase
MNALLRPALYGAVHGVLAVDGGGERGNGTKGSASGEGGDSVDEARAPRDGGAEGDGGRWDVVGPLCETGDVLARDVSLDGVAAGSLLAVRDAGAYGYVMASEYNAHPRPAQVWIDGDRWATITPRLTYDEMLGHERLAPWQETAPPDAG